MVKPSAPSGFGPTSAATVGRIYDTLAAHISPLSDLEFANPFQLLVAVVLSAQATDVSVNRATRGLWAVAPGPHEVLALGEAGLIPHIRHIGLFNAKARHVIALCRILIEHHDGKVPDQRAALEALPGVGRKTANVVLNLAFGQATIAVDTHVQRVANRLGLAATKNVAETEQVLYARTPRKHLLAAHHYLLLHGRYTCTARNPRCTQCPVRRHCPSATNLVD